MPRQWRKQRGKFASTDGELLILDDDYDTPHDRMRLQAYRDGIALYCRRGPVLSIRQSGTLRRFVLSRRWWWWLSRNGSNKVVEVDAP